MKKVLIQLSFVLALFFITWAALSRVNFMTLLKVDEARNTTEKKLGDVMYQMVSNDNKEIKNTEAVDLLNKIKIKLCKANGIDPDAIKVHLFEKDEVNAFALPDGHLVVYTGLIDACQNSEELAGVMGHEIGHIEKKHVMHKLAKEIGLAALFSMTSGQGGSAALKLLTSTAYDRKLESEADRCSIDYMVIAKIDPSPFANLMFRLALDHSSGMSKSLSWISTHPDSEDRAKTMVEYIKTKMVKSEPLLTVSEWKTLKSKDRDPAPEVKNQ